MKSEETRLIESLTKEVIKENEVELKKILKESIKKAIEKGCCDYFGSIESSIKNIGNNWVKNNLKPIVEQSLEEKKDDMKKHIDASLIAASAHLGSEFLNFLKDQTKSEWDRKSLFDKVFERHG